MQLSPHSLFHPCHKCIRFDGLRGEAVVLPPCGQRSADGEAGADHLLELGVVDGQYRLARCAEQLICQGEAQHSSAGQSTGGDLLFHISSLMYFYEIRLISGCCYI